MNIDKNPMYQTWRFIRKRCNPSNSCYNGSTICEEWNNSKVFIKWAEENYKDKCVLVSLNGHYSPETCKFLPRKEMMRLKDVKGKRESTNIKKYGVRFFSQKDGFGGWNHSEESLSKRRKTCLEKYGVDNVFKDDSVKNKQKKTCLEKYGSENVFSCKEIQKKIKETNIKKLGVEYPTQSSLVKDKVVKTNIIKFGKPYYTQTNEYKARVKKTNLQKYGYEFKLQSHEAISFMLKHNKRTSNAETEIQSYLNSYGFNFNKNYDIIPGKEIDLYDDNLRLGIEYCGVYWHCDKFVDKQAHYNKYKKCLDKNIRLLTIFDDEWINRKTMVKNFLRSVVDKNDKIYARNCEFKKIDPVLAKDFVNSYHIQPIKRATDLSFGLIYNNLLVSVMTFNKHHRGLDEVCLSRFCSINNLSIIGGGSKLLTNAIKYMGASSISTWSDNRYSCGDFYQKCGFKMVSDYLPDYSYVNTSIPAYRFSKQSMSKKKIGCTSGTEKDFLQKLGYYRIWDCGKKKWVYNLNRV